MLFRSVGAQKARCLHYARAVRRPHSRIELADAVAPPATPASRRRHARRPMPPPPIHARRGAEPRRAWWPHEGGAVPLSPPLPRRAWQSRPQAPPADATTPALATNGSVEELASSVEWSGSGAGERRGEEEGERRAGTERRGARSVAAVQESGEEGAAASRSPPQKDGGGAGRVRGRWALGRARDWQAAALGGGGWWPGGDETVRSD